MADHDLDRAIARVSGAKVTRRGFLAASGLTGAAAFLAACGASGTSSAPSAAAPASTAPSTAPSTAASAVPSAAESAAVVGPVGGTGDTEGAFYLYNWADYTDLNNIETFKKNYGITDWSYDTFGSNDEMITTLQGGKIGQFDASAPTADLVPTLVADDFIQKIDWSKVPNVKWINPAFRKQWWDPTDEYSLPKDWGTTGITVRTKDVKEPVTTWKQFFDLAKEYSGRIIAVNSQVDVFAGALKALGYSVNTEDSAQLEEMRQLLSAGRPASPRAQLGHLRGPPRERGGRPRPDLDGRHSRPAQGRGDRGYPVHHPGRRDPVLGRHLGDPPGRAAPGGGPRLPQLHAGPADQRRSRPKRISTPRRTTRRRSTSTRDAPTTR